MNHKKSLNKKKSTTKTYMNSNYMANHASINYKLFLVKRYIISRKRRKYSSIFLYFYTDLLKFFSFV